MTHQEILQELRAAGGTLAEAALNEIERLTLKTAELDNSLSTLTLAYNKLLDHMPAWINVKDRLPEAEDEYGWVNCIVTVLESVTSPFAEDSYDREFVSPAVFDSKQKIWHVGRDEAGEIVVNALLDIEDAPFNEYYVTHWMPLPLSAGRVK